MLAYALMMLKNNEKKNDKCIFECAAYIKMIKIRNQLNSRMRVVYKYINIFITKSS